MNRSGSTSERTLSPQSRLPCSASVCSTKVPKPPIAPSSMVTSTSCSRASRSTISTSRGLAERASATVVESLARAGARHGGEGPLPRDHPGGLKQLGEPRAEREQRNGGALAHDAP